jgi:hypothetical protein
MNLAATTRSASGPKPGNCGRRGRSVGMRLALPDRRSGCRLDLRNERWRAAPNLSAAGRRCHPRSSPTARPRRDWGSEPSAGDQVRKGRAPGKPIYHGRGGVRFHRRTSSRRAAQSRGLECRGLWPSRPDWARLLRSPVPLNRRTGGGQDRSDAKPPSGAETALAHLGLQAPEWVFLEEGQAGCARVVRRGLCAVLCQARPRHDL